VTKFLRARTWRLVEVAVLLLATAGAFEMGLRPRQILFAFVLTAFGIVIALLIITVIERWAKHRAKAK
jgi:hypothetical protein